MILLMAVHLGKSIQDIIVLQINPIVQYPAKHKALVNIYPESWTNHSFELRINILYLYAVS
mgnify:CR=1 FL=1